MPRSLRKVGFEFLSGHLESSSNSTFNCANCINSAFEITMAALIQEATADNDWVHVDKEEIDSASVVGYEAGGDSESEEGGGVVNGFMSTVAAVAGYEEVQFIIESRATRVKRTLSEFQNMLAQLEFRFPKTAMPVIPSRRWGNQIKSIRDTVDGWGGTIGGAVMTAGTAAGAAGVAVVSSVLDSISTNNSNDSTDMMTANEATEVSGRSAQPEPPSLLPSESGADTETNIVADITAYQEYMNEMCAGLTSVLHSLACMQHVWSSAIVQDFLDANTPQLNDEAEKFLLDPLPRARVQIARSDAYELAMVIDDSDGCVVWDFYVENEKDISFSVNFEPVEENRDSDSPTHPLSNDSVSNGVIVPLTRFLPHECSEENHVYGRYMPGRAGTVHLCWDNGTSLVHSRTLSRVVEVVDQGMIFAAQAAAKEAKALEKANLEEKARDDEVRRAMELIQRSVNIDDDGGMNISAGDKSWTGSFLQTITSMPTTVNENVESKGKRESNLLLRRLESMEDMVATMMAKRDQSTAMMMMERQSRVETEFLLRDTHSRLDSARTELSESRSECVLLREDLDDVRAQLSQQTSLASSRYKRLMDIEKKLSKLQRERDRLADEKRAWSFTKRDYQKALEADEARIMAALREKLEDAEAARDDAQREAADARALQRGFQSQVVQLKVQLKVIQEESTVAKHDLREALESERDKTSKLNVQCRTLSAQVSKYKTHKRVLVQELRKLRQNIQADLSSDLTKKGCNADAVIGATTNSTETATTTERAHEHAQTSTEKEGMNAKSDLLPRENKRLEEKAPLTDDKEEPTSIGPQTHIIQAGDNFHTLSLQYDMTILDIKRLNNLFGQNRLALGAEIIVTPGSRTKQKTMDAERAKSSELLASAPAIMARGWAD